MNAREKQTKLEEINKIMNACCEESISIARYSMVEWGVDSVFFTAYNKDEELLELYLVHLDDMIEIAKRIRKKAQNQLWECQEIARLIAVKYGVECCVEIISYQRNLISAKLYLKQGARELKGTYNGIKYNIIKGLIYETK